MESVPDQLVVLVAARDEHRLERLCDVAASVKGCAVVGTLGRRAAMRYVVATYEQPQGCPDVIVIDTELEERDALHDELDERCPGVRRIDASPSDFGFALELVRDVERVRHDFAA